MTTKSPSMRARWLYRVADWLKARSWPLLLAALLLPLAACGAWEDGAVGQPTPEGYIWIPGTPGTPQPLPTAPPAANEANERQNQCIHTLRAAHATLSQEEIVNGCSAMVREAQAP